MSAASGALKDDVLAAHRGDRVRAAPAVGVEHGQRPHLGVVLRNAQVGDEVVGVDVGVAVRDHHALGPSGRAGGVVDREQIGLFEARVGRLGGRLSADPVLVVGPAGIDRRVAVGNGDEVLDRVDVGADLVDEVEELGVDEDDFGAGVLEHVLEVGRDQAVVHRHDDRANRGGGVEGFEELVRVGRDDADAVALADPGVEQGVRLLIDASVELGPGEALVAIDDGLGGSVELRCAAQKIVDQQRDFHRRLPRSIAADRLTCPPSEADSGTLLHSGGSDPRTIRPGTRRPGRRR